MNKFDKRRLQRMHEKVDGIAQNGMLGWEDYKEYLDEVVNDSQFWLFQLMLSRKYGFDNTGTISLHEAKSAAVYDRIRLQTTSSFQRNLKTLYDSNGCHQVGKRVYLTSDNTLLGEIYQESIPGSDRRYLVDTVVAVKGGEVVRYEDTTVDLIDKYKSAIEFVTA